MSPNEINKTQDKSSNISATSLEEMSSNTLLARKSQTTFLSTPNCEPMCGLCKNGTAFCGSDIESSVEQENDSIRSKFLADYFFLLDVKQLRRTLFMSRGDRRKTWNTFVECLSGMWLDKCFVGYSQTSSCYKEYTSWTVSSALIYVVSVVSSIIWICPELYPLLDECCSVVLVTALRCYVRSW